MLVAILMLAATSAPSIAADAKASDRALTRALQGELRSRSDLAKVNGVVRRGVVYLKGSVSTASQRAAAEQAARRSTGIETVYNGVQVGPYSIYD